MPAREWQKKARRNNRRAKKERKTGFEPATLSLGS